MPAQKQTALEPAARSGSSDRWAGALSVSLFLVLPLVLFWPVTFGNWTMLPVDNLFAFEPYRTAAEQFDIQHPHNPLLSDLIVQHYPWRRFVEESFERGELPLWNPYLFSGTPFLAKGQHLALYPLSVIFFLFPLWKAYGVFTVVHLALAGYFTYVLARSFKLSAFSSLVAGLTYELSGFMLARCGFPMIIASAAWLPLILASVERLVARHNSGAGGVRWPWGIVGAFALGCQLLAGHFEIVVYTLLLCVFYAVWRSVQEWKRPWRETLRSGSAVLGLLVLGLLLGAVQWVPFVEVARDSFRQGGASLAEVRGWAYPWRQLIAFLVPNFFGNPSHWSYTDLATGKVIHLNHCTCWGVKNFVEGGAYLGLLPLFLAFLGLWGWLKRRGSDGIWRGSGAESVFVSIAVLSCCFIFGTPLYALVYFLPGMSQVHSPFRWVIALTLSVAVLAGYGIQCIERLPSSSPKAEKRSRFARVFLLKGESSPLAMLAGIAFWAGITTLFILAFSRVFFALWRPLLENVFQGMALAAKTFPDVGAFYRYECRWFLAFALLLASTGLVLRLSQTGIRFPRRLGGGLLWRGAVIGLLAVDLLHFASGFYPANDPALLDYRPPVVEFLKADTTLWRLTTYDPDGRKTFNANAGWLYHFQDVRGYDSLFSHSYREYLETIDTQDELLYNRISPVRHSLGLLSPLLDVLNVKYVLTEERINDRKYRLVYEDDAIRVYRNLEAAPRAFVLPFNSAVLSEQPFASLQRYDPRFYVILDPRDPLPYALPATRPGSLSPARVERYRAEEVVIEVEVEERSWLTLADSYAPGWKAFATTRIGPYLSEKELPVRRSNGIFRTVLLEPGQWTVRFLYRPQSVTLGFWLSILGGVILLASMMLWFWRRSRAASAGRRLSPEGDVEPFRGAAG